LRIAKSAAAGVPHVDSQEIFACLAELRLTSLLDTAPSRMQAAGSVKLLLAKAYFSGARFLVVDEPFAGLDRSAIDHCIAILERMRDEGAGILLTDHHTQPILQVADRIHIMRDGAIVYSETAEAARASPQAEQLYFRKHA
jgi:ABC-type lipopolysaccharide export system ATPase subunit